MERMGIHPKLIELTKQAYKAPTFNIQLEGVSSRWHRQATGIRQGCPLSPYLFLIVMTVIFKDVHAQPQVHQQLQQDKILQAVFDEVLYADDTIIFSHTANALQLLLKEIETESSKYGMKLNKKSVKQCV